MPETNKKTADKVKAKSQQRKFVNYTKYTEHSPSDDERRYALVNDKGDVINVIVCTDDFAAKWVENNPECEAIQDDEASPGGRFIAADSSGISDNAGKRKFVSAHTHAEGNTNSGNTNPGQGNK